MHGMHLLRLSDVTKSSAYRVNSPNWLPCRSHTKVEEIKVIFASSREITPTCGVQISERLTSTFLYYSRTQPFPESISKITSITNAHLHQLHQFLLIDVVEIALDIDVAPQFPLR